MTIEKGSKNVIGVIVSRKAISTSSSFRESRKRTTHSAGKTPKSLILHAVLPSATRVSSFVINSALVQSISLHRFVFLSTRERQIGRAYRVYAVFFSKFQMGICAEREIGTLKENRILSNTVLR